MDTRLRGGHRERLANKNSFFTILEQLVDWDNINDETVYRVVVNSEEQYSIWPDYKDIPLGWKATGKAGIKQDCLDYIKEIWTDMRPLSLRRAMAAAGDASVSGSVHGS